MDVKQLEIFIDNNLSRNLTPNGWYLLYCISINKKIDENINTELEKRKLYNNGFIDSQSKLTDTGVNILGLNKTSSRNLLDFLNEYRNLFPAGKIWGHYKKDSIADLKERFLKFFKKYDFSYDLILDATAKYIEEERMNDSWRYLKSSAYVIEKKGEPCLLAKLCEGYNTEDTHFMDFTNK